MNAKAALPGRPVNPRAARSPLTHGNIATAGAGQASPYAELIRDSPFVAAQRRQFGSALGSPAASAPLLTGNAQAVVQRAPIRTGSGFEFFDPEIPAFVTLLGFRWGKGTRYARYRVNASGVEFLYDYDTGLYYNVDEEPILPGTLAPTVEVSSGHSDDDDPPPGAGAIKAANEALLQFNRVLKCACPLIDLQLLPLPRSRGGILRRLLITVTLPDLLQLINEWAERTGAKPDVLTGAYITLIRTALLTPEGNVSMLQALNDITVTLSDLIIQLMPQSTEEELSSLALEDRFENDKSVAASKYEQALNELGAEFQGQRSPAAFRKQIVEQAFQFGFNLGRLLKRYKNQAENQADQVEWAIEELRVGIEKYGTGFEKVLKPFKLPPEVAIELIKRGLNAEQVSDFLRQLNNSKTIRQELIEMSREAGLPAIVDRLLNLYRQQNKPSAVVVKPGQFGSSGNTYESGVIDVMLLDSVARSKVKGHTLPVNKYIQRHFTPVTMSFLASHPSMYIQIYEGQVSQAFAHLVGAGYTQVLPFADNPATDFRKFTARDPDTGQAVFVIVGLNGVAYQREIAAHFLYYTPAINPLRIIHHRLTIEDAPCVEFERTLKSLNCLPDIIQMGNVDQVERLLGEQNIKPIEILSAPNLFGKIYIIGSKIMFSLRVEPQLYGDRAGAFLRAVQKLKSGKIQVIFTGTAGGLAKDLEVGDLLAPEFFHQTDTTNPERVGGVTNLASSFFAEKHSDDPGMFSGPGVVHGAVDTILLEDQIWFEGYQSVLTIVEQETAHLAKAASLCADRTELYVFFKISDLLGSAHDFTANETDRPEYRTPVIQGDVVLEILDKIEPGWKNPSTPKNPTSLSRSPGKKETRDNAMLFKVRDLVISISLEIVVLLEAVDTEFAEGLLGLIESLIGQTEPGKLVARLSKLFQLYNIAIENNLKIEHLPTLFSFTLKQAHTGDASILIDTEKKTFEIPAELRRGQFLTCRTGRIKKGKPFHWQVIVDGKVVLEGDGVGGETHKG